MAEFDELLQRLENWGRWGDADERGALNYITEEKRRSAAQLVRCGRTFSLAIPITNGAGPQTGRAGRINPLHFMTAADCAEDGIWEFMLVAQGLPITGGTGTPVNPLALK